jgi:hypothetical protein
MNQTKVRVVDQQAIREKIQGAYPLSLASKEIELANFLD